MPGAEGARSGPHLPATRMGAGQHTRDESVLFLTCTVRFCRQVISRQIFILNRVLLQSLIPERRVLREKEKRQVVFPPILAGYTVKKVIVYSRR